MFEVYFIYKRWSISRFFKPSVAYNSKIVNFKEILLKILFIQNNIKKVVQINKNYILIICLKNYLNNSSIVVAPGLILSIISLT